MLTSSKESANVIEDVDNRYNIGDEVFVKAPSAKCTTPWGKGMVTNINSNSKVEVNGIPRHVADLRRVPEIQIHEPPGIEPAILQHRPQRQCNMPQRYGNNIYDV